MAGKRAVCPNCRAVIPISEEFAPVRITASEPIEMPMPDPVSLDIARPPQIDTQGEDEKAALRVLRLVYVFCRRDWRRLPTCPHLWLAFLLFFLPWVNLSCNSRTLVTQTGLQSCYGAKSLDPKFEKMVRNDKGPAGANLVKPRLDESPPWSMLSIVYITFVVLGGITGLACIVCVFLRLNTVAAGVHLFSLGLGAAAFLAIAAQMFVGFPLEKHFKQQLEKVRQEEQRQNGFHAPVNEDLDWFDVEAKYTVWLWLSLLVTFVSVPVFLLEFVILIVDAVNKHMRQRDESG